MTHILEVTMRVKVEIEGAREIEIDVIKHELLLTTLPSYIDRRAVTIDTVKLLEKVIYDRNKEAKGVQP